MFVFLYFYSNSCLLQGGVNQELSIRCDGNCDGCQQKGERNGSIKKRKTSCIDASCNQAAAVLYLIWRCRKTDWQILAKRKFKPASPECWLSLQFWGGGWSTLLHCTFWWSPWNLNLIQFGKILHNFTFWWSITSSRSLSFTPGIPNRGLKHTSTKDLI